MIVAKVRIWDIDVGAIAWDAERNQTTLEFLPEFVDRGIDLAPVTMPLAELQKGNRIYSFPNLNADTFRRLPGLLADSLPDSFGNALINIWLAKNGRSPNDFSPVERLCYTGARGMGALEYEPVLSPTLSSNQEIQLDELVEIAKQVLNKKKELNITFTADKEEALRQIIQVGTSAGGMRPKAIIAISPDEKRIVSGYIDVPPKYNYWIIKFDGVQDEVFGDPQGYGIIEYVYYLMAKEAGIAMSDCQLFHEHGRSHFMTRRFDRVYGQKIHMQTLTGIAHYDFNNIGSTSYEQLFQIMRKLKLGLDEVEQMYRRLVFNVIARNQDDHTKNTSFLLPPGERWKLSPAYDITYSYNPDTGRNTHKHQMSINGKRSDINRKDLITVANSILIKRPNRIIDHVLESVSEWERLAQEYGVAKVKTDRINQNLRLDI
jgi:serine/threonine-protein kinase HipA